MRANENIALTAIQTLFAREHNRIVARAARRRCPRSRSSRSPGGWSAPSSSTSPTTSSCRRSASACAPYRGYDAERQRDARQRVRDRRLPRAQHDPRRVRAGRARPATTPRRSSTAFEAQGIEVEDDGDEVELVDPAQRRVRQPRPARARRRRPGAARPRRRARVQQRRADRQPAAQRAVPGARSRATRILPATAPTLPGLLQRRGRPRRDRHRARPRPRHAALQRRCARPTGCAPKTSFTAITGESTDRFPTDPLIDPATRSTIRTSSTSSQLRRHRRQRDPARRARSGTRTPSPASAARRSPPG